MFAIIAYIQNHIHDDLHKPIALHNVAFSPPTPESFFFFIFINILFFLHTDIYAVISGRTQSPACYKSSKAICCYFSLQKPTTECMVGGWIYTTDKEFVSTELHYYIVTGVHSYDPATKFSRPYL